MEGDRKNVLYNTSPSASISMIKMGAAAVAAQAEWEEVRPRTARQPRPLIKPDRYDFDLTCTILWSRFLISNN